MKYPYMITVCEANERENIYFSTKLESRIHFEDLKKGNPFDMFLSVFDVESQNYTIVETFLNNNQHSN